MLERFDRDISKSGKKMTCCTDIYQLPMTKLLLGECFHPGGLKLTRQLAQQCLLNRNSLVLDIACGQATSAKYLTQQYGATIFALDLGLANLKQVQTTTLSSKIKLLMADAHQLPLPDNSLDMVLCECALSTFNNRDIVLAEIFRVLKPGGFIALSDFFLNKPIPNSLKQSLSRWLCISDTLSAINSQQQLEQKGFYQLKFINQSNVIFESIKQIQVKLTTLQSVEDLVVYFEDWQNYPFKTLTEFLNNNGAGYYTLTARKLRK